MHDLPVGCAPPPPEHADTASENTPTITANPTARSLREALPLMASRSREPDRAAHAFEGHPGLLGGSCVGTRTGKFLHGENKPQEDRIVDPVVEERTEWERWRRQRRRWDG